MSLANLRNAFIGSEPVDKIKMSGIVDEMFSNNTGRSIDGLSTNVFPRFSATQSTAAKIT